MSILHRNSHSGIKVENVRSETVLGVTVIRIREDIWSMPNGNYFAEILELSRDRVLKAIPTLFDSLG